MLSVAPAAGIRTAKHSGGPRTTKRQHEFQGDDGHCVHCGVKKGWPGEKGPCPPKVQR